MSKMILAQTHPPEYLIQKYWARKPHNVLAHYIKQYFPKGSFLVDPFCGSGVFLAEAKKQNQNVLGFDINPTAFELSYFTLNPPVLSEFKHEVKQILDFLDTHFSEAYTVEGKTVRYFVHELVSDCKKCGTENRVSTTISEKNSNLCLNCKTKISFNFENAKYSEVVEIILDDKTILNDKEYIKTLNLSHSENDELLNFDRTVIENRRILAFKTLKLSSFFTHRAIKILNVLDAKINAIPSESTQRAVRFFVNSCLIQFSRLLPYRNQLTTGGPAWSIPGFWIAAKHLETNPMNVLKGRFQKFIKAIERLQNNYQSVNSNANVLNIPFQQGFLNVPDNSVDGIFFDPPYGDNVPYLEFSFLWNSFYKANVDYENEVIVSDRTQFISKWEKYDNDIKQAIGVFQQKLKFGGKVILTFNNLDMRAWTSVMSAFRTFNFKVVDVNYQVPAVVSSKAQMAKNTSYVGDFYCVFEKMAQLAPPQYNDDKFQKSLLPCLYSREGKVFKNLLERVALLIVFSEGYDLDYLINLDKHLETVAVLNKDVYEIKDSEHNIKNFKAYNINTKIIEITHQYLSQNKTSLKELYLEIMEKTEFLGAPLPEEINLVLQKHFVINAEKITTKQPTLF